MSMPARLRPLRLRSRGVKNSALSSFMGLMLRCGARCAGVCFTLKRHKQVKADVLTLAHFSQTDCVRAAYSSAVANHVAPLHCSARWPDDHAAVPVASDNDDPTFSVQGLITLPAASLKKTSVLIFINGRPVDCHVLRSALESAYATLHSKATTFWAFLDVRLPASHVDVNVHPTKSEVALLYSDELAHALSGAALAVLTAGNDSRPFAREQGPLFRSKGNGAGALGPRAPAWTRALGPGPRHPSTTGK